MAAHTHTQLYINVRGFMDSQLISFLSRSRIFLLSFLHCLSKKTLCPFPLTRSLCLSAPSFPLARSVLNRSSLLHFMPFHLAAHLFFFLSIALLVSAARHLSPHLFLLLLECVCVWLSESCFLDFSNTCDLLI